MEVRATGNTDVGRKRERNEDSLLIDDDLCVYAVADGMGGHAAGHIASRKALEVVQSALRERADVIKAVQAGKHEPFKLLNLAEKAVLEACKTIFNESVDNQALSGMGCTLTLVMVTPNAAVMAHVGDTRLYLFRDGDVDQVSTDHTLSNELNQRGMPTAAKAYPNVLTRSIGQQEAVQVDTLVLGLHPDDVLLLCSDGLHNYLEGSSELAQFLGSTDLKQIPPTLIDLANERGGHDNITAIVLKCVASDEEQEEALKLSGAARRRVSALRSVELFSELPFSELVRIVNASTVIAYEKGEEVIRAGQVADQMFMVTEGEFVMKPAVGDFHMELKAGDHMGDTMLMLKRPCRATLTAKTAGEVLELKGEKFQELVAARPWLGIKLLMRLARTLSLEFADLGDDTARRNSRSSRLFF